MATVKKTATKMDQARSIYKSCTDKSRGNIVPKLEDRLGMSKAMAGTYYQLLKHDKGPKKPKAKKAAKKATKKAAKRPAKAKKAQPATRSQPASAAAAPAAQQ